MSSWAPGTQRDGTYPPSLSISDRTSILILFPNARYGSRLQKPSLHRNMDRPFEAIERKMFWTHHKHSSRVEMVSMDSHERNPPIFKTWSLGTRMNGYPLLSVRFVVAVLDNASIRRHCFLRISYAERVSHEWSSVSEVNGEFSLRCTEWLE